MSWITLTEADVQTKLAGAELTALKSVALSAGQGNPLPAILAQVVQEVRGYVAACTQNKLGDGATIPQELETAALAIIRYRLATRLPVASLLTDARKEEYRDALTLLRACAACNFRIEQPATPSAQIVGGPAVAVASSQALRTKRSQMRGL